VLQDAVMADKVIRIEGHTDSAGADASTRRLSYRRAVAVQPYLATAYGLPHSRRPVVEKGQAGLGLPVESSENILNASKERLRYSWQAVGLKSVA
jgi:OmpA family protein